MKFITELELRSLYKQNPFDVYVLEPAVKLTPGARQFLADRQIAVKQSQDPANGATDCLPCSPAAGNWCMQRLRRRLEAVHSLFLLTAAELLLAGDSFLSEEVLLAAQGFRNVQQAELEQTAPGRIQFRGWTEEEIRKHLRQEKIGSVVGDFHVGLKNGKEIILLHHLRVSLQEIEPLLLECYWDEAQQNCTRQDLIDALTLLGAILSMMIKKCLGGQQWNP